MMLVPCLLAGGSGTRLWPLSRGQYPKQFLRLIDDKTLLQNTALRAGKVPDVAPPLAICGEQHRFIVAEQLRESGVKGFTVLLEPEGRNTAPAAACAALWVEERYGPDAQLLLMAADNVVADLGAFLAAVAVAREAAAQGRIVTFGVTPDRPETGFGYIKASTALDGGSGALVIDRFVEKPSLDKAKGFLAEGGYYWNSGMFLFRADTCVLEMKKYEPEMEAACREALLGGRGDIDFVRLDAAAFKRARNESLDYAIMEKTDRAALVPLNAGWDDVGSWSFLERLPDKDARGNVARGDVWLEDVDDSLIHAESRLVAAVGLKGHIVVETSDAVLVTTVDRAQEVKAVVQRLKAMGRPEAELHPRVYRPWGWYETITIADRFQVKRIQVKPGEKLSLQMHHHRAEHWIVVKGTAKVTCGEKVFLLTEDQSTYIPLGHTHRLENPGKVPIELIEVQSGAYLGEDDIVRFDDVYGRTPEAAAGTPATEKTGAG